MLISAQDLYQVNDAYGDQLFTQLILVMNYKICTDYKHRAA